MSNPLPTETNYYAVIGGPMPGVVQGYEEAKRRWHGHRGAYVKRGPTRKQAAAYYWRTCGAAPPEVVPNADIAAPTTPIVVEGPNGLRVHADLTAEQLRDLLGRR